MKVAVLGAGSAGERTINHLKECKDEVKDIVAYDIHRERVSQLEQKYQIKGACDLKQVFDDRDIKLVFVTSSNASHEELTVSALKAGKAVMCEKPMAATLSGAKRMAETADNQKGFLQIGFELRYSRLYARVKEWIDAGLLGRVVNTHCLYVCEEFIGKNSWRISRESGGMFGEKLSHYVDLPRWWIGDQVQDVSCTCAPNIVPYYEIRDNYHTTYRFRNGAVSHLTFFMAVGKTFNCDPLLNWIDQQQDGTHVLHYIIQGTKGAAITDVFGRHLKRLEFKDSPSKMTSHLVEDSSWDPDEDELNFHNTRSETLDIVTRVTRGLPPATPPWDAYETTKLCFAAETSANSGKTIKLDEFGD